MVLLFKKLRYTIIDTFSIFGKTRALDFVNGFQVLAEIIFPSKAMTAQLTREITFYVQMTSHSFFLCKTQATCFTSEGALC